MSWVKVFWKFQWEEKGSGKGGLLSAHGHEHGPNVDHQDGDTDSERGVLFFLTTRYDHGTGGGVRGARAVLRPGCYRHMARRLQSHAISHHGCQKEKNSTSTLTCLLWEEGKKRPHSPGQAHMNLHPPSGSSKPPSQPRPLKRTKVDVQYHDAQNYKIPKNKPKNKTQQKN
jgi:hypothetical protein